MGKPAHVHLTDLRAVGRLATDAAVGVADLVEAMHRAAAGRPWPPRGRPAGRTTGITGFVYRSVRGITKLSGFGVDALLSALGPLFPDRPSSRQRESVVAALNGLFGDHLQASGNPLSIRMGLRRAGVPVAVERAALSAAYPDATGRLLVLVHGLCMDDRSWNRAGHDHGAALARDLGYTPLYLRYNTGRGITVNGRELADLLQVLVREWPRPVESLAIVGHSMGGLVARAACHHGALAGHAWPARLDDLVFLGTPHFGAPLERAGALADLVMAVSPYSAPLARLGRIRSEGIKDLGHGFVLGGPRGAARPGPGARQVPLPRGVRCHAIAASAQAHAGAEGARIRGDGLVPVASALGQHRRQPMSLRIPAAHRWIAYGADHFDVLSRADVYERVRAWLAMGLGSRAA